jgi:hypothetical protein
MFVFAGWSDRAGLGQVSYVGGGMVFADESAPTRIADIGSGFLGFGRLLLRGIGSGQLRRRCMVFADESAPTRNAGIGSGFLGFGRLLLRGIGWGWWMWVGRLGLAGLGQVRYIGVEWSSQTSLLLRGLMTLQARSHKGGHFPAGIKKGLAKQGLS